MNLIDSMKYRMPWPVARAIFKSCGIPVGRGWEETEAKMHAIEGDEDFSINISMCMNLYKDHILHGEKNIKLYKVTSEQLENIHTVIDTLVVVPCIFAAAFPFVVDHDLFDGIE